MIVYNRAKKATEEKIFCLHEKKRPLDFAIGKYFSIFAPLYQKGGGINAQAHERGPSSEKHLKPFQHD